VRRVLYRLPAVLEAARAGGTVYVAEGEKDVHALERAGAVATCNPAGAGKWRPEYADALAGAHVVVVADADEPGRKHARQVAASLEGKATSVAVVAPGKGKDAADHLAAGRGLEDFEPLTDAPSDLGGLLQAVEAFLRRFVLFSNEHQAVACALWVVHVYFVDAAGTTPYLRVRSAAPESGKSRLVEALWILLGDERAEFAASLSPSTMFRAREETPIAFLIDEADNLAKRKDDVARELLAIVNAGYRRGASALRSVPQGKGFVTKRFPVFGPTVIAGLGQFADTTESRCIPIVLQRKPPGAGVEDFMLQLVQPEAATLRAQLEQATSPRVIEALAKARPDLTELRALRDRSREVWWPLVAIADAAGGSWPARARAAAVALHGAHDESDTSTQILLLAHIERAFDEDQVEKLASAELLRRLVNNEQGPWGRWWGAEVERARERSETPHAAATELAAKLKPFGVTPGGIRLPDGKTPRGYKRQEFEPVWDVYLPPRNNRNNRNAAASDVAPVAPVAGSDGVEDPICASCGEPMARYPGMGDRHPTCGVIS
jgi:hypothetical protein